MIWLIINYLVYVAMVFVIYIQDRNNISIKTKALQKLLKEVAEIDLMRDLEAWQKIAFRANCCFMKKSYNNPIFYSGEQRRWFFVREIVKPVEFGSYNIRCCYDRERYGDYFQDLSNKKLAGEQSQITRRD